MTSSYWFLTSPSGRAAGKLADFMPGGFMPGGFMPGGFMPGGFMPGGFMPGGFMPGGFMPGGQVWCLSPAACV